MQSFRVLVNGQQVGSVEAMNSFEASALAQHRFKINPMLCTFRTERDGVSAMHLLIDETNYRVIARHDSHLALAALATIQFHHVDTVIIRGGRNASFSIFDAGQLCKIADSIALPMPDSEDYSTLLKALRAGLESSELIALPFTTEALVAQAYCLAPTERDPYAFDPTSDKPKKLSGWPSAKISFQSRIRRDTPHWHCFAAGLAGAATPETLQLGAKSAPFPLAVRPPTPPRPAPAPKPPRVPVAAGPRPKEGTSTGKVWDICDALLTGYADPKMCETKAFRKSAIEACEEAGINASTASVQYGKWKASKNS